MSKKAIVSPSAPKVVGPYRQAVEAGGFIFLSGVMPLDAVTNQVSGGDVKSQTEKVLQNLESILKASDLGFASVVKTTVFMTNLADFADMNEVYARFFTEPFPARTTAQAAALPRGVLVELDAIAVK